MATPQLRSDYYVLLGVEPTATTDDVRTAFQRLGTLWHPDRAGPAGASTYAALTKALEVLTDPEARAAYDRAHGYSFLRSPKTETSPAPRKRAPAVMLSRLSGPMDALLAGGMARRLEGGVYELVLASDEAEQGGMITISMRVQAICAACDGGAVPGCVKCSARGVTEALFSAWLAVPPGVENGASLVPSAQLPGVVRPVSFRVKVREA